MIPSQNECDGKCCAWPNQYEINKNWIHGIDEDQNGIEESKTHEKIQCHAYEFCVEMIFVFGLIPFMWFLETYISSIYQTHGTSTVTILFSWLLL